MIRLIAAASVCLLSMACETHYSSLRFRPVDTTSQLLVGDVQVLVSKDKAQPLLAGSTDEHGHVQLKDLRAGDMLIFTAPGYEKAAIWLEPGAYLQRSPEASGANVRFHLQEGDTVPVPLHRAGRVEKPEPIR